LKYPEKHPQNLSNFLLNTSYKLLKLYKLLKALEKELIKTQKLFEDSF